MKKKSLLVLLMASMVLVGCDDKPSPSTSDSSGTLPQVTDSSGTVEPAATLANGAYSYVASSYSERTKILGQLEKYAVDNYLTGITVYEDGAYVMYDTAVKKGTNTYIPGYGFGVVSEGEITADMATENNAAWKRYYHTFETEDPNTLNYMNDDGSVVGDYVGYVWNSYWDTQMNETKDGYEWVPSLAVSERPIPVNADDSGLATKYKFEVRVGDAAHYGTLSSKYSAYNGRAIQLEDYLTPFKILYTQSYGMKRGADQLSGSGSIKGLQAYYNATKDGGFNAAAWENVGIKASTENGKAYLEFEFNLPTNQFYAMYYLSSSLNAPVPESFITALGNGDFAAGVALYGNFSNDLSQSPVDTILSSGPYMVETWNSDQEFVFKRNPYYTDSNRYKIAGVHVSILKAAKTDAEYAFNRFINGYLHAAGIPLTKLSEYKTDPRTTTTVGSTTTKLNLNTCTQEVWNELFGVNGTVAPSASEDDYWDCKPIMSNRNFVRGLSYAIDRFTLATNLGRTPTINYFGSAYMSDPENGISYNSTPEHKAAIADLLNGTDAYGYSEEKAKAAFKTACDELIASGAYKAGDEVTVEVAWQSQSNVTQIGDAIEKYWTDAFNNCGGGLTIKFKNVIPSNWQDVYSKMMQVGRFDIGFGGISGNPLNPLNFLEVLKSDNSSRFTLNWGLDTNSVDNTIVYDGKIWSFDALWQVADQGGYVENGKVVPTYEAKDLSPKVTMNEDGSATLTASIKTINIGEDVVTEFLGCYIYTYATGMADYVEDEVLTTVSADGTTVTITLTKEIVDKYKALVDSNPAYAENLGMDFYFDSIVLGQGGEQIITLYFEF